MKFLERIMMIALLIIFFASGEASVCQPDVYVSKRQTEVEIPATQPVIHFTRFDFAKW